MKPTGKVDHTPNCNVGRHSDGGANVHAGKYQKLDTAWAGKDTNTKPAFVKEFGVKSTDGFMSGGNPNQPMKSRGNA